MRMTAPEPAEGIRELTAELRRKSDAPEAEEETDEATNEEPITNEGETA